MQIVRSKSHIVEKVLRDKEGRLVRANFCVYESAGRLKARLIDFVYLDEKNLDKNIPFVLSGFKNEKRYWTEIFESQYISPYVTFETFYSLGSKPRAPTF